MLKVKVNNLLAYQVNSVANFANLGHRPVLYSLQWGPVLMMPRYCVTLAFNVFEIKIYNQSQQYKLDFKKSEYTNKSSQ